MTKSLKISHIVDSDYFQVRHIKILFIRNSVLSHSPSFNSSSISFLPASYGGSFTLCGIFAVGVFPFFFFQSTTSKTRYTDILKALQTLLFNLQLRKNALECTILGVPMFLTKNRHLSVNKPLRFV